MQTYGYLLVFELLIILYFSSLFFQTYCSPVPFRRPASFKNGGLVHQVSYFVLVDFEVQKGVQVGLFYQVHKNNGAGYSRNRCCFRRKQCFYHARRIGEKLHPHFDYALDHGRNGLAFFQRYLIILLLVDISKTML